MINESPYRRILLVGTLFLLTGVLCAVIFQTTHNRGEPTYGGKPLSTWLRYLNPHEATPQEQQLAVEAVRQIGTNGVPMLMVELSANNGFLRSGTERRRAA